MNNKEKLQNLLIITCAISQYCYDISQANPEIANEFGIMAIGSLGLVDALNGFKVNNGIVDNLEFYQTSNSKRLRLKK